MIHSFFYGSERTQEHYYIIRFGRIEGGGGEGG